MVDVNALKIITILKGGSDTEQTSLSRDVTRLYVANEDVGMASVIEISSGRTLAQLVVGESPKA